MTSMTDVAPTNEKKKTRLELPKQQKDVLEFIRAFREDSRLCADLARAGNGHGPQKP
jgi:hypothetical protein